MERNLSLEVARIMADAALATCRADGFDVTVAVVDRSGEPRVLLRANTSNPHNADLARRKAYTARTFGIPSGDFGRRTEPGMPLAGQRQLVDVIALGGGVPVMVGNERIGGIGVSGANTEGDEKCAQAGLAAGANFLR
jgi:uncharacterized protein GlcG (DUF336 family)